MKKKAIIISIKGHKLLDKEREILRNEKPWGLILFKRNIHNLNQIKKLVKEIRKVSKDRKFPIMIDEEGSSVTRLSKILYNSISQKNLGDFYLIEKKISLLIYKNYIKKITSVLKDIGVNINTVPVLDVLQKKTHKIIEDRCFSKNQNIGSIKRTIHINQKNLIEKKIPPSFSTSISKTFLLLSFLKRTLF